MMEEVEYAITAVDPKKKIQTGSFRVGPDGELTGVKKIQYARSETHLTEVLEVVCERFKDYAEMGGKIKRYQVRDHHVQRAWLSLLW